MNQYEVTKECWINGTRYLSTQLIKLTDVQAKEWLDRKCIKPTKETLQDQLRKYTATIKNTRSVNLVQTSISEDEKQAEQNKDASNNQDEQVVVENETAETKEEVK